jgi:hypothetical protein
MPRRDGSRSEPGRSRTKEKKCAEGAWETGVMPKRFDEKEAPSGLLFVTGGMICEIMELRGRARPRIPSKSLFRGSPLTVVAAARERQVKKSQHLLD